MKHIIRYYHMDGGDTFETVVMTEALQAFITVLLTTGYRIIEIV